ncbi:related to ribosomal protein [Ramularia collo-cygni]|uniref:Small ribosomal subunit protein mS29 n=1 Tax=Ramularia collo-cygni TaxID=112498 RepID=A0A2D3UP50_9PEZI|nr:related to ribosomal protein [Ramularia collo-cygni]CZT18162.1 related to ribosomal protein [Ramularia collo-cygni]
MQPGMSSSMCLRCLRRSLGQIESSQPANATAVSRAAFSTSSSLSAQPVKKKAVAGRPAASAGKTLRLTKNKRAATTRPPAIGERRELRKRVVLSNTNALEVKLQDLKTATTRSSQLHELQGKVLGVGKETVDALSALEVFKPTQGWSLFHRPATLVRKETVEISGDIEWIAEALSKPDIPSRTVRKVLFGERGSGKSVLQLQALAMASLRKWVVVHIPEAKDLTNAHTSYQPITTPDGTIYIQPHYTAKLLGNIAKANQEVLAKLKMTKDHKLPMQLPPKTTLARLAELGANDPEVAWPVWEALWSELLAKDNGQQLPPVVFCLDGVDHVMRLSAYLNPEAEPIHAHELALVRHFVGILSGKTALPNGGMVLAATSESNRAAAHTLDHCLQRNLAIQEEKEPPIWDPYTAHDKWVQEAMETVRAQKVLGLSKAEARGIMEYYAHSGMMRQTVTDGLVSEKWTLAGGGIIGQVENGSVRARF